MITWRGHHDRTDWLYTLADHIENKAGIALYKPQDIEIEIMLFARIHKAMRNPFVEDEFILEEMAGEINTVIELARKNNHKELRKFLKSFKKKKSSLLLTGYDQIWKKLRRDYESTFNISKNDPMSYPSIQKAGGGSYLTGIGCTVAAIVFMIICTLIFNS